MNKDIPEYLDKVELHLLTGFARGASQSTWLKEQGIPHRQDGRRIIASRIHVQAWLEGRSEASSTGPKLASIK